MAGATSRLCWHDLKGSTVELAIEMHRQRKKAEARNREQEAQDAATQEDEEARIEFERQRDNWLESRSQGENQRIDTAGEWVTANGDG